MIDKANDTIRTKHYGVPPFRYLPISAHESGMDVSLLVQTPTTLCPDLFAEVKDSVD